MANVEVDNTPTGTVTGEPESTLPDYLASPDAVLDDRGVVWRYGRPPDYSRTRKNWQESKKMDHAAGSLPQLVENLVKNWEIEASFKSRLEDWRTIDHDNYTFAMNGGSPQPAAHMLRVGTYNAIIAPNEYYSPQYSDFATSHKTFKRMMPTFAWEVIEVYSGPPTVSFKWRHWGEMKNDYVGFNDKGQKVTAKAHGGPIEIFGVTVAKVDEKTRIQAIDTWMDPLDIFRQIAPQGVVNQQVSDQKHHNAQEFQLNAADDGVNVPYDTKHPDGQWLKKPTPGNIGRKHIDDVGTQPVVCPFIAQSSASGQLNADGAECGCRSSAACASESEDQVRETFTSSSGTVQREACAHTTNTRSSERIVSSGDMAVPRGKALASDSATRQNCTKSSGEKRSLVDDVAYEYLEQSAPDMPRSMGHTDKAPKSSALVDEHFECPAYAAHQHPETFGDAVMSHFGEAVVAPADSMETRTTQDEMSSINDEECSALMNRE